MQIAAGARSPRALRPTETRRWRAAYFKDYYEPALKEVTDLNPVGARSVLSIGCGSRETEAFLSANGRRVAAIPLDGVISAGAAARRIEILDGDLAGLAPSTATAFDCVQCLNILHLAADPVEWLSLARRFTHSQSVSLIRSPNMASPGSSCARRRSMCRAAM